jgi:hypothetical protein
VRHRALRLPAALAAAALFVAACGDADPDTDPTEPPAEGDAAPEDGFDEEDLEGLEDLLGDQGDLEDPNELVDDGVFRGAGVVLPVPEGWTLDPTAYAQGVVAAVNEAGNQQLSAQAIDAEQIETLGQSADLDALLDNVRQLGEADVDEEVQLEGAERAHRLTYRDLPAQQEGLPETSATIVLAQDDRGYLAEFTVSAAAEDYDEALEDLLLDQAGFDPDSEPPSLELPAPPEG